MMTQPTSDDWRSNCVSLAEMQVMARDKNLFTDIQFVIGKGASSKVFNAHKMILACGSSVFEKMLYGSLAEQKNPIHIEEDDPGAFSMLLDYLYGMEVQITSFINAWEYFVVGDKYLVEGIVDDVADYISDALIKEEDFWEIIKNGIFSKPFLSKKVNSYIEINAEKIFESEKSQDIPETVVKSILRMEKLNISENDLLQFLANWGCKYFGCETNSKQFLPLLQHIRFSVLETKEFCSFIDKFHNVIDPESSLEIMKHLHDKLKYNLPKWCSTRSEFRNAAFQKKSPELPPKLRKRITTGVHNQCQVGITLNTPVKQVFKLPIIGPKN